MKRFVMLALLASLLSGCTSKEDAFNWSVDFCGGKEKVLTFSDWGMGTYAVRCVDGRWASVP